MAIDYLNKNGLSYFWSKLKAYFAPKAHTHTAFETKHSYTTAANAAKNWYRIANANTSQTGTTTPIHAQFILTAYNASYDAGYYERWFVNAEVFGRNAHIVILGNTSAPFSQARILYENTIADLDTNDRPAIDLYLNYVLPNGTTKIEIEEVYNSGWTFVADGQISASTVPTGFENMACSVRGNGVERSTYADYVTYLNKPRREISTNTTLADNNTYRSTTLNCTGTITITVPSLNSNYAWFFIKNANVSSGVITVHPSTTSVLIDGSNANITLQPNEYIVIHSRAANSYSIIADGRFSSKTVAVANKLGTATVGASDAPIYLNAGVPTATGGRLNRSLAQYVAADGYSDVLQTYQSDNNNYRSCTIRCTNGNGFNEILIGAHNESNAAPSGVSVKNTNGTVTTGAPTPAVADNSTKIATTAWCRTATGNFACNAATASAVAWSGVTGKPTTIADYGITDAKIANGTITLGSNSITPITSHQTLPTLSRTISGSGNAITDITVSNHAITATKGATFLTSHQTLPTLSKTDSGSGNAVTAISVSNHAITVTKGSTFALDSNVIHKNSNEAIGGIKEFGNSYHDSTIEGETDWESSSLIIRYQNYVKGSGAPSANKYANLIFLDKTGTNIDWNGRLGSVENDVVSDGTHRTRLVCYKNEIINGVDTREYATINVGYDSNGIMYASAPETDTVRNSDYDILTRSWIPKDTRIVHTTGDETINGEKTFTTSVKIKRGNPYINFVETDITKFTDNTEIPYQGLYFRDKNEDMYASLVGQTYSDRSNIDIYVYDRNDDYSLFRFYRKPDGTETFASFPTPPANSNSTQVVTAAWVNSKGYLTSHQSLANYVTLNGAQSITGAKTFTQSIEINRGNPYVVFVETDLKKGTGVDSGGSSYQGLYFEDKSEVVVGSIIGNIYGGTAKQYWITLRARDFRTAAATDEAVVGCEYNSSGVKSFRPEPTNDVCLGISSRRWKEIWCNQSSINTSSDERIKDFISDIPDEVLDAWGDVHWRQFKYKDAIAEKGASARIHSGAIAQEVDRAFHAHNLDVSGYGLFLHDSWEAVEETRDDRGTILSYASPAGDEYGLRYVEALCMEAAYMRRENARLKKRVADLEERLAALELKIS